MRAKDMIDQVLENGEESQLPYAQEDFVREQIVQYLQGRDEPPMDDEFHEFAEGTLGLEPHMVESAAYALLHHLIHNVGLHRSESDDAYDTAQLAMGIKVEMEHTNDPAIAKEIAKDHLAEFPDYYDRLAEMEYEAKEFWQEDDGAAPDSWTAYSYDSEWDV